MDEKLNFHLNSNVNADILRRSSNNVDLKFRRERERSLQEERVHKMKKDILTKIEITDLNFGLIKENPYF